MTVFEAVKYLATDRFPIRDLIHRSQSERASNVDLAHILLWMKLASSELHAFVQDPDNGAWYQLPRSHWVGDQYNPLDEAQVLRIPEALERSAEPCPAKLINQPVVFWRDDVHAMEVQAKTEVEELLGAVTSASLESLPSRDGTGQPAAKTTPKPFHRFTPAKDVEDWYNARISKAPPLWIHPRRGRSGRPRCGNRSRPGAKSPPCLCSTALERRWSEKTWRLTWHRRGGSRRMPS